MGKKYSRFIAATPHPFAHPSEVYGVEGASVVVYQKRKEGWLWWEKLVYDVSGKADLTRDMKTTVWGRHRDGSGICRVEGRLSNGEHYRNEWCILQDVDGFEQEVAEAIRRAQA